jgi:hypothetical protein
MPAAVDVTDVRNSVQQLLDSASSAPVGTTLGSPVIRRCSFWSAPQKLVQVV